MKMSFDLSFFLLLLVVTVWKPAERASEGIFFLFVFNWLVLEIVIRRKLIMVLPASGWTEDVSCCDLSASVEGRYRLNSVCTKHRCGAPAVEVGPSEKTTSLFPEY